MSPKTIKIIYWTLTSLFVLFCLFDGYGGVSHMPQGVQGVMHLGYPVYLMDISGVAKLIGAVCIIQTRFKTIKEWAYAGFTISFISAAWSHLHVGDAMNMVITPILFLAFMFLTYYFWKKYITVQNIT